MSPGGVHLSNIYGLEDGAPPEVRAARELETRKRVLFADLLGERDGPELMSYIRAEVLSQRPDPGVPNPNENLWCLEGQRVLLRWMETMISAGMEAKRNEKR